MQALTSAPQAPFYVSMRLGNSGAFDTAGLNLFPFSCERAPSCARLTFGWSRDSPGGRFAPRLAEIVDGSVWPFHQRDCERQFSGLRPNREVPANQIISFAIASLAAARSHCARTSSIRFPHFTPHRVIRGVYLPPALISSHQSEPPHDRQTLHRLCVFA